MTVFKKLKEKKYKKILLISPTSPREVGATKWLSPNLGIERVAGYLNANGHYAETYDTNLYKSLNTGPSLETKLREQKWDVVGFSVYEDTMSEDISNLLIASHHLPDALLVAGGPAAQFDYQTILDKSPARIVVLGEGEKPLLKIVEGFPLDEIPGIVVKNCNTPLTREEFKEVTETINYEQIPYELYWDYYLDFYRKSKQEITLELSQQIHTIRVYTRNYCPIGCKFCSSTNFLKSACGKKAISTADISGKDLLSLVKRIIKAHPRVETIYFTDDDFCSNRKRLIDFLHLVIEENLLVTFISFARIDDLDEEIISLMVKANFRTLNIGVENFQPEILKEYNKKLDLAKINENLELLNFYGIRPAVTFILCSPEAKLEWVENTTKCILEELEKETIYPGVNVTVQPQKGACFYDEYHEFEIQQKPVPGTDMFIKRVHFIKCADPEVREFQYRFLQRWTHFIDEISRKEKGHLNSQRQSALKLKLILEVIEEIKSEREIPGRFRSSNMSADQRDRLWSMLEKYSYGASL